MNLLSRLCKKPEIIVAALSLLFGLVFIGIIRPLQTPDEAHHFIRAYEISEGKIAFERSQKGSCMSDDHMYNADGQFTYLTVPKSITNFAGVIDRYTYSIKEQIKQPLNVYDTIHVCADQTAANSPIGYLPQALVIVLLRPFNTAPILMDYAARLAILAIWTTFIYAAVKIIPVRKWAVVGIALLPIAVQQSIAIGPDVLSVAPAVLAVAYIVRSYYEDRRKDIKKDLLIIGSLIAIAALAKPIMILLILLLPFYYVAHGKKKGLLRRYDIKLKSIAVLIPIITWSIWGVFAAIHHISTNDVFLLAREHTQAFKDAPLQEAHTFTTEAIRYVFYDLSLWGYGSFEWFTATIPKTFSNVGIVILALILMVSYTEKNAPIRKITAKHINLYKLATLVVAGGLLLANIFTLYMIYTKPEYWLVTGMQFRYLLSVFFVLACVVETKFLRASDVWYRNLVLISSISLFIISVLTIMGSIPPNVQ